jgi:hypothetical protein
MGVLLFETFIIPLGVVEANGMGLKNPAIEARDFEVNENDSHIL